MKKIINLLESSQKSIAEFTKTLIKIPTVNPPGINYENIVSVLRKKLSSIGLRVKVIETPRRKLGNLPRGSSKRLNLIADWDMGRRKTLHINGHYDVVPVGAEWRKEAFRPAVANGKIYGRGAEDMKGTISAAIFAVFAIKRLGLKPNVNIELSFTPDEETGGDTGFGYLVENGLIKADFAISEGHSGNFVSSGSKGLIWANIIVYGKSSHGSTPYKGINAFEKMLKLACEFKDLREIVSRRKTNFPVSQKEDRFASLVLGGLLKGGEKINTVPGKVVFSIDRRILPEESLAKAKAELESVLKSAKRKDRALKAKMEILAQDEATNIDTKSPICEAIRKAINNVYKKDAHFAIIPFVTDLRYLIKKGIPAIGYSAGGGGTWHSDNEFVSIKSIVDTAKVYALTIMNLED